MLARRSESVPAFARLFGDLFDREMFDWNNFKTVSSLKENTTKRWLHMVSKRMCSSAYSLISALLFHATMEQQ